MKKNNKKINIIIASILMGTIGTASITEMVHAKSNENKTINNREVNNKEYTVLVNRENKIEEDYMPKDLVVPNIKFLNKNTTNKYLKKDAAIAAEKMFNDARKEGINLLGVSGFRTYRYQNSLYINKLKSVGKEEADKYVAQPGTSEHQTGLALDVLSTEYSTLDAGFENTKAYKWLIENMSEYGFILRYKKGKNNITGYEYEPWHVRYVGKESAKEITEKNLTLEEYIKKVRV